MITADLSTVYVLCVTICGPHHGDMYDLDLMMIATRILHVNLNSSENNPYLAKFLN